MISEFKKSNPITTLTLESGLRVVIFHKPEFVSSAVAIGIKYGSLDFKQVTTTGEVFAVPSGTAHFLEHKMFEDETGDLMSQFAELGASVNAFTSFEETVYYFQTTEKDITAPLQLLLKLVANLTIDEASVIKEQGIIIEELLMYQQLPDNRLYFEMLNNLYLNYPLNQDIGGDIESVKAITKDSLRQAFLTNYQPHNMVLVISSPIAPESILKEIKNSALATKQKEVYNLKRDFSEEPVGVAQKTALINLPVDLSKIALGIKFDVSKFSNQYETLDLILKIWLKALFSSINPQYQEWLDKKLINDYFDYDLTIKEDYGYLIFFAEKLTADQFQAFIFGVLENKEISQADFKQIKRSLLASAATIFNSTMELTLTYLRNNLANSDLFESIDLINQITLKDIDNYLKDLDLSNYSIVEIK